jgi:(E)-4-hydroxy-3-methylbut-2-enyl-diphosphate synthase
MKLRKTKVIKIGSCFIGAGNPVAIQSMTKVKTADSDRALEQVKELESAGCEIVRLAIKDTADAKALKGIKKQAKIPLVADIHFHWHLAIEAIDSGADKIRLNPGNIYKREEVREIARAAKLSRIPIRVGVNSGSLSGHRREPTGCKGTSERMVKAALDYIRLLESFKFSDIVVSLKGSNILDTIEAYRKIARLCNYPLHLGVTATGPAAKGIIKSSIAIGSLLLEGLGDTIRISLTDTPVEEVKAAKAILSALRLRSFGPEIISCPTCGRCDADLPRIVRELENSLAAWNRPTSQPLKVAVMGCVVNGPGEAKEADLGVAFGSKDGLLFKNGRVVKKVSFSNCVEALLEEIKKN